MAFGGGAGGAGGGGGGGAGAGAGGGGGIGWLSMGLEEGFSGTFDPDGGLLAPPPMSGAISPCKMK